MAHSPCHPLLKFRVARLWEETTVVVIHVGVCIGVGIGVGISVGVCISIGVGITALVGGVCVLAIPLLLLADIHQHEKSRGQSDDKQALKDAVVNVKVQIIIISVLVLRMHPHEVFIVCVGFVELVVIVGCVILDESLDPFFEGTVRSRV